MRCVFAKKMLYHNSQGKLNKQVTVQKGCYCKLYFQEVDYGNKTKNIIFKENIRGTNGRGTSAFNDAANQYIG